MYPLETKRVDFTCNKEQSKSIVAQEFPVFHPLPSVGVGIIQGRYEPTTAKDLGRKMLYRLIERNRDETLYSKKEGKSLLTLPFRPLVEDLSLSILAVNETCFGAYIDKFPSNYVLFSKVTGELNTYTNIDSTFIYN